MTAYVFPGGMGQALHLCTLMVDTEVIDGHAQHLKTG